MTEFLLLLFLHCWIWCLFGCELFYPQVIRVNNGDTLKIKSVLLDTKIYDDSTSRKTKDKHLLVEMTQRAYCINDLCSIPGPTLVVNPGITINIELENAFHMNYINLSDTTAPDITNIHTHGLHISGEEDNVFKAVYPSQSVSYTWTIHPKHHLGTNWYHAHHHTSTALHVFQGMYGALIVDSKDNKKLDYNKPTKIKDYIIQISWQYLHDNKYCQNCFNYTAEGFSYFDSFKGISSLCDIWCGGTSQQQRDDSGYEYDVSLHNSENNFCCIEITGIPALEVFLVNNLYQPTLYKLQSNEYFKLRIISASASLYTQLHFDYNEATKCKYSAIARDGIAFRDGARDLWQDPYYGAFLLPPGGRLDVLVLCTGAGVAQIYHHELHPQYMGINDSYPMGRIESQILFKLSIDAKNEEEKQEISYLLYPEPTQGYPYYLNELIESIHDDTIVQDTCACSNYNRDKTEDAVCKYTDKCAMELIEGAFNGSLDDIFEVNGVTFDEDAEALFLISLNQIYRFYINSDGHPLHIHVNPFMVEHDLLNGYIAKQWDMMDTLGYNKYYNINASNDNPNEGVQDAFYIRYNTRDFATNVILHCHFLGHEDLGMMGFIKIVDGATDDKEFCEENYEYGMDNGIKTLHLKVGKEISMDWHFASNVLSIMIVITAVLNVVVCFVKWTQRK